MMGVGSYTQTEIPRNVKVGKYSSIASKCIFMEPNQNHLCIKNRKCVFTINWSQPQDEEGVINIGNDVWIGTGVLILPGVTIEDGAIIGAGAVISKDVPPYAVVVGNPMRIMRMRFTPLQVDKLSLLKWWDKSEDWIIKNKDLMMDIDKFLEIHASN